MHKELFQSVTKIVEENGLEEFQNEAGVSLEGFLESLDMCLMSTYVPFETNLVIQKQGVCVGSTAAPALCSIYLTQRSRTTKLDLIKRENPNTYRYTDDLLVIQEEGNELVGKADMTTSFTDDLTMKVTVEEPKQGLIH